MDTRICFIGDSFINGTGDPEHLGWTGRVCAAAHTNGVTLTSYNLGVRRDTSSDILSRWQSEVTRRLFPEADNRLVFSFGVNDTTSENGTIRVHPDLSCKNTYTILESARSLCPVIMIGPAPIDEPAQNDRTRLLDHTFQRLCQELSVPYLSVFDTLLSTPTWMNEAAENDGAHPGSEGYQHLANLIQSWDEWWF